MQTEAPPPPAPPADPAANCPRCGTPAERDQPFCLECGRRIGLSYRKPPSFRIPLALVALLVIAIGVAAGFAVTQATQEDDDQPDAITVNEVQDPGQAQRQAQQQEQLPTPTTPAEPAPAAEWPVGTRAYTIVLLATKDAKIADATAAKAVTDGTQAGVLDGKDFQDLDADQYFVFSGQFEDQAEASVAAKKLTGSHPTAAARLIEPK